MEHASVQIIQSKAACPKIGAVRRRLTLINNAASLCSGSPASIKHDVETTSRRQIPIWNMVEVSLCTAA
jgi:hypothetical protein